MTNHTHLCGPYTVTVWGRGTCLALERDGLSLFWQGDEAGALLVSQQEVHAQETKRLQARIQQPEQWRDAAIARYPDLDVDPALLAKARDIAIRTSDITTALADDILAGEWDQTPIMRATLEALKATYIQGD